MKHHDKALRALIRRHVENIGAERYRITRSGEVHFYGTAPGSIVACWWLFAQSVEDARTKIQSEAWQC
jgi:hypothetical protein